MNSKETKGIMLAPAQPKLGRAERRRQEKEAKKSDKKIMMSQAQLQQHMHETIADELERVRRDVLNYAVNAMAAAFTISLHDEFGFGNQRLNRLLFKVNNQFDCIEAGTVSLEDFGEWCKEYGIDFKPLMRQ